LFDREKADGMDRLGCRRRPGIHD